LIVENPKMTYATVDRTRYGLVWFDRGDHFHLKVFKDNRLLGFKNLTLNVEMGDATVAWAVRSIVRARNESQKKTP